MKREWFGSFVCCRGGTVNGLTTAYKLEDPGKPCEVYSEASSPRMSITKDIILSLRWVFKGWNEKVAFCRRDVFALFSLFHFGLQLIPGYQLALKLIVPQLVHPLQIWACLLTRCSKKCQESLHYQQKSR